MMIRMLMAVLRVGVIVQPGENDGTARRATCRSRKGIAEKHAIASQRVDGRSFHDRVSVTTERRTKIVADDENDVLFRRERRHGEEGEREEGEHTFHGRIFARPPPETKS